MLSDIVMRSDNEVVRIVRFIDFGEEVGIGDMKEGNVLGGETIKGASDLKKNGKEWRAWRSREVGLLLEGRSLLKLD